MARIRQATPWLKSRNGVFYIHWYNPDRRREQCVSLRTSDPDEAKIKFGHFLVEGKDQYLSPRLHGLTVRTALADYLKEHAKNNADSRRAEDCIALLNQHFGNEFVRDIDIPMCREYLRRRTTGEIAAHGRGKKGRFKPASPATVRRELVVLNAAAKHATRWKNPDGTRRLTLADLPVVELPPASRANERWLTRDELARLRSAATGRLSHFIDIAYYTASRRDAIETLTWFQVDLDGQRIRLAKQGERQTKKRRPIVAIDPMLMPLLRRLHETKKTEFVLETPGSLYRPFTKLCARLGIEDVTPHTLRHTRATHLLQDGVSLFAVANLLGDTVATVERVYGHHSVEYMQEVMKREVK